MLESLITSKTRIRLLVKFFISAANEGYLRGLAGELKENTNAIRKELNNLSEAGYLIRVEENSKITYRANKNHPLFGLIQTIIRKYVGLDTIIENIVDRVGEVQKVYLVGDYAKGIDSGLIEVFVIGQNLDLEYIEQLIKKIESKIHKNLKITVADKFEGEGLLIFDNRVEQ